MNIPLPQNKTIILNNWDLLQWIQLFIRFRQVFTCQAITEANNKHENITCFYLCKQLGISNHVSHMGLVNAWKVTNSRITKCTTGFPHSEIHRTDPNSLSHDQQLLNFGQCDDFHHPAAVTCGKGNLHHQPLFLPWNSHTFPFK